MLQHPRKILILICRVHHNKIMVIPDLINNQIIHHPAVFITHGTIPGLTVTHIRKIIRQQIIQVIQRPLPFTKYFPHMGYIKKPAVPSHRHMFLNHPIPLILHRQKIPRKRHHLPAILYMNVIQRSLLLIHHLPAPSFLPGKIQAPAQSNS